MNPETFNAVYSAKVDEFLSHVDTFLVRGKQVACMYCRTLHVERAPLYRLPPEIIEFLQVPSIRKQDSYIIAPRLVIEPRWRKIQLNIVNGKRLPSSDPHGMTLICDGCETNITKNYTEVWSVRDANYDLCETCYRDERFGQCLKEDFAYFYIPDINFLDWVEFGGSIGLALFVNCNPQSSQYGHIASCSSESEITYREFNILYKTPYEFIQSIEAWILQDFPENSGKPQKNGRAAAKGMKYLNSVPNFHYFPEFPTATNNVHTCMYILEHEHDTVPDYEEAVRKNYELYRTPGMRVMTLRGNMVYMDNKTDAEVWEIAKADTPEYVFSKQIVDLVHRRLIESMISDTFADWITDCIAYIS
jgi:hypothetical protein